MTLVLFTHYYPYTDFELFLESEIEFLAQAFSRIIVVPRHAEGHLRQVPANVEVDVSLAERLRGSSFGKRVGKAVSSQYTYREIGRCPQVLLKPTHLKRLLGYVSNAETYCEWVDELIKKDAGLSTALFYTYWFYDEATGIAMAKEKSYPQINHISRAHGYDIYAEQYVPAYIPFREFTIGSVNKLCPISAHGKRYLEKKYEGTAEKLTVFKLGVHDPLFSALPSAKGHFHVVSCSHIIPLKRLDLLIRSLRVLGKTHPELMVQWDHIGGGECEGEMMALAEELLDGCVRFTFHGYKPNKEVFDFFRSNPIDVLMLLSTTEGLPVAIMEAFSCGVPVIATGVGGVPEIVNESNGILLEEHPSPKGVAEAMATLALDKECALAKGRAAKETWRTQYNAEGNYCAFVEHLKV